MGLSKHIRRIFLTDAAVFVNALIILLSWCALGAWQQSHRTPPQPSSPRTSVSTAQEYAFTRIGLEQGLSQSSVYAMMQDKRGFLWIGTQDGINKYDGYRFIAYHNVSANGSASAGMKGTLPNAWITQIVCDKYDNLWIGSNGGGLAHIHRDSNQAMLLPVVPDNGASKRTTAHSLTSGFVTALTTDNRGSLWIGTEKGLRRIDTLKASYQSTSANVTLRSLAESIRDSATARIIAGEITALVSDRWGRVWVGTRNGFFCYKPKNRWQPSLATNDTRPEEITLLTDGQGKPSVQSLFADSLGRIWVGTLGKGVLLYNPDTRQTRVFSASPLPNTSQNRINSLSNNSIFCFATDERGYLWIGTDNGVNILQRNIHHLPDDADVEVAVCRSVTQMSYSLSDNAVRSLYCDASGTMWVGTLTAGMSVWNPLKSRFGRYSPDIGNATFLPYRVVRSFYEESDSVLWVGTDDGLVRWNRRSQSFGHLPTVSTDGYGLPSERIWSITRDAGGIFWFGTDGGGLCRYDPKRRTFTNFQHNPNDSTTVCNNRVRLVVPDNNGCLWLGTLNGLDYFNPQTHSCTHFRYDPQSSAGICNDRIQAVFCDADSTVWMATAAGLTRFDRKHNAWKHYFRDADKGNLPNNWVRHVMRDRDGTLWVATVSGIAKYDPQKDSFIKYGLQQGLLNEYVYGIVEDTNGFLWMGTDKGLARFDKKNNLFRVYEAGDGLQSNEFNTNAFYRTSSGELLFGGVNGMNIFHPNNLRERLFMPPIVLTAVKIFNVERFFDTDVSALQELALSYQDHLVEFDFAALDFANIARIQYAYMMEGIDKEFVSFGTRNFATYTNLPAGEYIFRVRATNADGIWNARELRLRLKIVPPFWETWWFRSGLFLIVCGIILGGVQLRLRRIAQRNMLLKEEVRKRTLQLEQSNQELAWSNGRLHDLNNEKNAILGIAAHDLKTPLSTMLTLTELVENDNATLSHEELYHFNSLMRQSANRMMALITQLLNMNMIDEGKLNISREELQVNVLIAALVADAEALARPKNLIFHYDKPDKLYYIHADQSAYMQIIENLLSNAVKYSPLSKNVWVELAVTERDGREYVICSVRDEGNGLTDEDKKRLFGKFARLSARPTGGEHSTGLGLSIVKKLVEAMNGEIWCESEHRKGATFSVAFPRIYAIADTPTDDVPNT
jgi:ligand-binding sensor domain-containing protein/signal transduction histidine kinase